MQAVKHRSQFRPAVTPNSPMRRGLKSYASNSADDAAYGHTEFPDEEGTEIYLESLVESLVVARRRVSSHRIPR